MPRVDVDPSELPHPMRDAWHVDIHRGAIPALLDPVELVSAAFNIPVAQLAIGHAVSTPFGEFYVDHLTTEPAMRFVLLHTWAPGSTARFGIMVRERTHGACEAVLFNSVHPTSWLGRVYFRAIELGHHLAMEVVLRRLSRRARDVGVGGPTRRCS